ncbi:hypothetical protein [Macrococcus capreoli]|uniref:hypothetical protein n=1 Tax=Macrococcus capreoli TaxID=2982690 RepID=UPI0021D56FBC|nr:hypothetical protein [Macrococcus sp. TMW 2.2395]MCU7557280.1 hypothetical protein [Macrococcus sp. TMW 2.2395]
MARGRPIEHPREFYYYLNVAINNGVDEFKYRRRVRKGYSYEVAAKHWDGVELTEAENRREIESIYKHNMPLKKSYLKYLEVNSDFLDELIGKYGYTQQIKQLLQI